MPSTAHVDLIFEEGRTPGFSLLLQSGFLIALPASGSVRSFLVERLNLSAEFIESVVQSVFLDGKPVDDMDAATVRGGCTLALSAAMPGLVGAVMRRGGYYSCLRDSISYQGTRGPEPLEGGEITVKLFNLVAGRLGPELLACGVWVRSDVALEFFGSRPEGFWTACESLDIDGAPADHSDLPRRVREAERVFIRMTTKGSRMMESS